MKIVALSDIHGHLKIDIPQCDIVCICGDILPLQIQRSLVKSTSWLCLDFKPWAESLPCKHVVYIAGNHDFIFDTLGPSAGRRPQDVVRDIFGDKHMKNSKMIYLRDECTIIDGVKFYGTPWCPNLSGWAFYKDHEGLLDVYNNIPSDTDILLSHCPPQYKDVGTVLQDCRNKDRQFGSSELFSVLENRPNIKWVLCGHIHSGNHNPIQFGDMNIVNVSIKDENYDVAYKPFIFDYDK